MASGQAQLQMLVGHALSSALLHFQLRSAAADATPSVTDKHSAAVMAAACSGLDLKSLQRRQWFDAGNRQSHPMLSGHSTQRYTYLASSELGVLPTDLMLHNRVWTASVPSCLHSRCAAGALSQPLLEVRSVRGSGLLSWLEPQLQGASAAIKGWTAL